MSNGIKASKTTKEATTKIKALYQELVDCYKLSLNNAIEIGGLLSEQKKELEHGHWLPWVAKLPFSRRSASNYISLFDNRKELKKARVANLNKAYKVLASYRNQQRDKKRTETKKFRDAFVDKPTNYINPQKINYINQALIGENYETMQDMLKSDMAGEYTAVVTSPGYNADFNYGK